MRRKNIRSQAKRGGKMIQFIYENGLAKWPDKNVTWLGFKNGHLK